MIDYWRLCAAKDQIELFTTRYLFEK
jgi:hypothetical protein